MAKVVGGWREMDTVIYCLGNTFLYKFIYLKTCLEKLKVDKNICISEVFSIGAGA